MASCVLACSNVDAPVSGGKNGNTFTYNSTVTFTCDPGYNLTGDSSIICQANGSWSASVPTCPIYGRNMHNGIYL